MAFTFRWVSTPGQNNSFVNESVNGGRARAIRDDGQVDPFDSPLYICIPPTTFQGGNAGAATLFDFARLIATCGPTTTIANPGRNYNGNRLSTGGTFTLNGNACGNYEYNVLPGGTTLTQAMVATLFSSTLDISTWIICKGDLIIGANTTLIPNVNPTYTAPATDTSSDTDAKRRLFMVVYATGNLTLTDATSIISMTACGGNTSATGANIGTFNIPIATNIYYSALVSPIIQSVGGAGGAGVTSANGLAGNGGAFSFDGSALYTGGGGSGNQAGGANLSGAGGSGSAFSGGAGGGSASRNSGATDGSSLGGVGGTGSGGATSVGGTGNPGGTGGSLSGKTGTGGIVIVITEGTISNAGYIKACGVDSAVNGGQSGGASGGGIVAVIQSSSSATIPNVTVSGGTINSGFGGKGGDGTTYKYGINS
jgi:hypothetical protein